MCIKLSQSLIPLPIYSLKTMSFYQTKTERITMRLSAPDFDGEIPSRYTCDGDDITPLLEIYNIPPEAEKIAIIVDDPDAPGGTFDHWIAWNLLLDDIEEGSEPGIQGKNDFGELGYQGPCPPQETHSYRFRVFALSKKLDLEQGSTKEKLEQAIKGNIIGEAEMRAEYGR